MGVCSKELRKLRRCLGRNVDHKRVEGPNKKTKQILQFRIIRATRSFEEIIIVFVDFAIQVVAIAIVLGIFLHGGLHVTCDFPRIVKASPATFDNSIAVDFHDHRKPSYGQILETPVGVTGILMVIIMFFAMLLATHWFRRNLVKLPWPFHRMTGFNAFWYSHHLFIIVYVLLIVHSMELILTHSWRQKTTWMYLTVPLVLYISERILRLFRAGHLHKVDVVKASIYPGNVLAIHMTKPEGFRYKSGMYLFLQCSQISPFEW
jgi:respiratory burst oxidase